MPVTVVFAQSIAEYGAIGAATEAAHQAWYAIVSWFRGNQNTAWLVVAGMVVLLFALRKKRRRY